MSDTDTSSMGELASVYYLTLVLVIVCLIHGIRRLVEKIAETTCMECGRMPRKVRMKYCNHLTLCEPCGKELMRRPAQRRVCHQCTTPVFELYTLAPLVPVQT